MKNLKTSLLFLCITLLSISCSNDNVEEVTTPQSNQNLMTLNKKITFQTYSQNPTYNTKRITYYSNNVVIGDTIFNNLNQWTSRYIKITNGNIETTQQLDTSGQIITQQEITFDNQGRIISRRTNFPQNVITVSFEYNTDNTITVKATNTMDATVSIVATFYKNSDGLIYKKISPNGIGVPGTTEETLQFDGLKPTSFTIASQSSVINFDYYSNPMPLNLLKTTNQLNNSVLSALTLTVLATNGNFYYKRNNFSNSSGTTTYQTDFNINNYIEYYKSTSLSNTNNNSSIIESFYYYN
ncbi:hypothetical protein [Flavobacterium sp.]|jgi:hypothetical protein|uniref:hypothetical protein n=1 Tax=Flavobacterium sp. TaxID=239 RepID=UPI0037BF9297